MVSGSIKATINWSPQDASKFKPNEQRTVTMEELKSIQGFNITCIGVPYTGEFTKRSMKVEAHV